MGSLLPIVGSLHFHALCLILASAAAAEALVAIWAATSRLYWFWRAIAVWCAVMALVPIRAYEPSLTFAISSPLTILLIRLRWRNAKLPDSTSSEPAKHHSRLSYSIRDLLLSMLVIGAALASLLHVIQKIEGPAVHAANFACVAGVTFAAYNCWISKRRLVPAMLLIIAIATCAAAVPFVGSQPETYEALSLINVGFHSSHLTSNMVILSTVLSEFAGLVLAGLWLANRLANESRLVVRRLLLLMPAAVIGVPLAVIYWQMLWLSPLPPPFATGPTHFERLLGLATQIKGASGQPLLTPDQQSALIAEAVELADFANYVPYDASPSPKRINNVDHFNKQAIPFTHLSRAIEAEASAADAAGETENALKLRLANVRLGVMLERGGEEPMYLIGRSVEGRGLEQLVRMRRELTADQLKSTLIILQRAQFEREPPEPVVVRDRAVNERAYGWACRLENILAQYGLEADVYPPFLMVARERPHLVRMLQTDLAVRLFRHERGRWPHSLNELVPDYLAAVPIDLHSGQPLIYRPSDTDFVLYSVGQDAADNSANLTNWRTYNVGIDKGDHTHFGIGYDFDLDTLTRP
jgi:hypothetical protein